MQTMEIKSPNEDNIQKQLFLSVHVRTNRVITRSHKMHARKRESARSTRKFFISKMNETDSKKDTHENNNNKDDVMRNIVEDK
jgi:hypothetical protein